MEILISVVAKIAQYLVTPLVHPCTYLCSCKTNCENLKSEIRKLKAARDSIQQRVDASKIKGEEIGQNVEGWLISVEKIIDEVGKVIEEEEKSNHQCFNGLCPNFKNRYQLSKKAVKEVKTIAGLQEEGRFEQVSRPTIPEEIWLKSSQGYMQFESRKLILEGILDALRNPKLNIIGVYGMGGIGKTTLVEEVARQAKEDKLFDKVISAKVSQTPDIIKIQGEIAEKLGMECKEQSETLRAGRLYERLKKEPKILIILDDIWGDLDLKAIGIPLGDDDSGRKILLTSRSEDVLSCKMDSQRNFFVDVLNEMETWSLFKKMAGDCIENGELKSVATAVAKACAGLPIAIVPVARALRNKRLFEWKDALLQLKRPSSRNFTGIRAVAYSSIEVSYNHLEGEELKNIFLLIGYTYITSIDDLLIVGMGLGLFDGINKMEDAQIRGRTLVNKLKTSCMLLPNTIENRDFSMHDVVRDVAISIASRDQHVFTAINDQWYESKQNICTSLVLHDVNSIEFPEVLECPQLKFFSIDSHNSSISIPDEFFMRMKELRVLNLSYVDLLSLPSSLCRLINLRTLRLYDCKLANIADTGDLKKLEILCLRGSTIKHLPVQVGQLTRLRLLDLRDCDNLEVVPPNVISCLSHLEELYMGDFAEWEVEGLNNERRNASLEELKHLSKLTSLKIRIKDVKTLPGDLFFKGLERYKILIGNYRGCNYRSCRQFMLGLANSGICFNDGHLMQLKGVEDLFLFGLQNMKNVLYGLDRDGFPQLKHLHVVDNSNLLCVVESTDCAPHNAFPLLETLFLLHLIKLEKICCGQLTVESFSKLKQINVAECNKLKNIFSFSIAIGLQRLQSINVRNCSNMEEIFAIEREDEFNNEGDVIELNQLRSLGLFWLPQLTSFCSKLKTPSVLQQKRDESTIDKQSNEITSENDIDVFDTLFNNKVVLPNLENLALIEIKCEKIWHNQLGGASCCVQNLTHLSVSYCDKLKYIFSSSMISNLVQLQHLEVCDCALLEEIVAKERGEESAIKFVFPRVTDLYLSNLQQLRAFYPGIHTSDWPVLKSLAIDRKILNSNIHSFQNSSKEGQSDVQAPQHLFLVKKVFPKLKELEIEGKGIIMEWQGQVPEEIFHKLKVVEMLHDKSTGLPLGLLQRLETLKLMINSYKEIFSYEQVDEQDRVMLAQLKYLELSSLDHLKRLWKGDLNLQNLTALNLEDCDGLLSLVTPPIAKTLFRLQSMNLLTCKMMTEIVANEGDVANNEIIFNELKELVLYGLESLTSFCSGKYTFIFPCLDFLEVIDCPKMKTFSNGVLNTPLLQRVNLNWQDYWEGDVNTIIQQFNKEKIIKEGLFVFHKCLYRADNIVQDCAKATCFKTKPKNGK